MGEKKKQAHQALYRKYRSKSLDEVIGQEHVTKTLKNALKQGKVSHAYLFTGPRGVGKTSVARILAHEVNKLAYDDEKSHLDIIEIDAASNRRIDDIRDLREKVTIAPINAPYKVYIIDEVHMLTTESFNALLKTLEEPPAHAIFILATTEIHKLPATIVSRTQRHSFRLVPVEKVAAHLKEIATSEGIDITDGALTLLAHHGEGSFRDSISLLDQLSSSPEPITEELVELVLGLAPREELETLLDIAQSGQTQKLITQLEHLYEIGLTPSMIAKQLLSNLHANLKQSGDLQALPLIKQLLLLPASSYPQLTLETSLLEYANSIVDTSDRDATTPQKPTIKSPSKAPAPKTIEAKVETKIKPSSKAEAIKPKKQTKSSKAFEAQWPEILNSIKQKNNSLYTVLRLAKPQLANQELDLLFGFEFHQKRADTTASKQLISESVNQSAGMLVSVVTHVDKSIAPQIEEPELSITVPAEPSVDPAHASLIAQVQDMMGGGEVVNV